MQRSTDHILTTHTGSLPRPAGHFALLQAKDDGEPVDSAALEASTLAATREIVCKQVDAGIDIINDGEMSKISYATYVKDRLTGFGGVGSFPAPMDIFDFPDFIEQMQRLNGTAAIKTPACDGPIAWRDRAASQNDIARLKTAVDGVRLADVFMTAASPGVIATFLENKYYDTHERYLEVIADVMRDEYRTIVEAGFILQLDCPDLGAGGGSRDFVNQRAKFVERVELHIAMINRAIAGLPADRLRLHLCWGNYAGPHHLDVPLRDIVETVLQANVMALSFEAANPRHEHEWRVFRDIELPPDKVIVPGVIDSCTNYIEHPQVVADRITRFADVVGRERVIAGSDCGFATFAAIPQIAPSIAWAKLQSLAHGARLATASLWGLAAAV